MNHNTEFIYLCGLPCPVNKLISVYKISANLYDLESNILKF